MLSALRNAAIHIFDFIELFREEHEYQHHKSEESRVQLRKRKKVNDAIDENLELLLNDHKGGSITHMQLAIKCGRALKIKLVKWFLFLLFLFLVSLLLLNKIADCWKSSVYQISHQFVPNWIGRRVESSPWWW